MPGEGGGGGGAVGGRGRRETADCEGKVVVDGGCGSLRLGTGTGDGGRGGEVIEFLRSLLQTEEVLVP